MNAGKRYTTWVLTAAFIGLNLLVTVLLSSFARPTRTAALTVYVFLNTECPVSQQYTRRLGDIYRQYAPSNVQFVALFPFRTDSPQLIRQFRSTYKLPFIGRPDEGARLARQFGVKVTPEVVVVPAGGRVRYRGAIDDWYVALGKHRPDAVRHYLRDALDALLAGEAVAVPVTEAVGCLVE